MSTTNQLEIPRGCVLGMTLMICERCGGIENHLFMSGGHDGEDKMVCQKCEEGESSIVEDNFGF